MEQQNEFLLQRLAQMEAENSRLSRQVAQLSAELRGSRSNSPKSVPSDTASPTLTPMLFKQEGDEVALDRIPFPTPSITEYSSDTQPSNLAESSDVAQHPAAVLCDLQCQSVDSKDLGARFSLISDRALTLTLQAMLQLLFLTMTSAAYSTVIHPLSRILHSLKMGSPLTFSTEEIYQHFPLILWLISTPSLSPSTTRRSVFRMKLLTRLLACSPALARPLRDATGRALQLAARERFSQQTGSAVGGQTERQSWELLLTLAWAIDSLGRKHRRQSSNGQKRVRKDHWSNEVYYGSSRSSGSLRPGESLAYLLTGKPC